MPTATFKSALISSADGIPDWADRAEFKAHDFEDMACVAVLCGGEVAYHWDGGESEDNLYKRDWHWVAPTLDKAYEHGAADARADERSKIAAFLRAEAERFIAEVKVLWVKVEANTRQDRLMTEARHDRDEWIRVASKASMARTLAAYVARGDHELPAARGDV